MSEGKKFFSFTIYGGEYGDLKGHGIVQAVDADQARQLGEQFATEGGYDWRWVSVVEVDMSTLPTNPDSINATTGPEEESPGF